MSIIKRMKYYLIMTVGLLMINITVYADTISNPCTGILSIVDRPSKADSACSVPDGQFDLEGGYQYQNIPGGDAQNFPSGEFRVGLPFNNEIAVILPNYNIQSVFPHAGFGATTVSIKHEIGYTSNLVAAVEGLLTFPSGSNAFGSHSVGGAANAIATYSFNSAISTTAMLGVSTQTLPTLSNGQRYSSFNPDFLVSWDINDNNEVYAEIYGQTNAGPGLGSGCDVDAGFMHTFTNNIEVDIEAAQRLSGLLNSFNNYIGAGFGVLF